MDAQPALVHYLPIGTTLLAALFATVLLRRYGREPTALHLLWWGLGVLSYGVGTLLESSITLFGNALWITKAWYIAGALLGGYPLAQGSVFLLTRRSVANRLTWISLPVVAGVALLVVVSPVVPTALEPHRPSGSILAWSWIRALTPFINVYALVFLVGGAGHSALRYLELRREGDRLRAAGNVLIAIGGLLPAVGGTLAKTGRVEALYIAELAGLMLIWTGFVIHGASSSPEPSGAYARSRCQWRGQ